MKPDEHPFQPGAKVIVRVSSRWSNSMDRVDIREVDKVYKNGNFTLKGDASRQQYYPSRPYPNQAWKAYPTGRSGTYSVYRNLELVTDKTLAKAKAEVAEYRREVAFNEACEGLRRMPRSTADAKLMADVTKAWREFEARQKAEAEKEKEKAAE